MTRLLAFVSLILAAITGTSSFAQDPKLVRLGTSSSVMSSGFHDLIVPRFEAETGYRVETFAVGSGQAMRLGRRGDVDILITHAPTSEAAFIESGYGVSRTPLMKNYFLIIGPAHDPAGIKGSSSLASALRSIASTKSKFASRGDDSGTHKRELAGWQAAGIAPYGSWYIETGTPQKALMSFADNEKSYALTDLGTWLLMRDSLTLEAMVEDDPILDNVYSILRLNTDKVSGVNSAGADALEAFLTAPETLELIRGHSINNHPVFQILYQ